jgi:hypothetical protein
MNLAAIYYLITAGLSLAAAGVFYKTKNGLLRRLLIMQYVAISWTIGARGCVMLICPEGLSEEMLGFLCITPLFLLMSWMLFYLYFVVRRGSSRC